ncbi:MAG: nitrilase-related carbon-nitrogen hydrolase, partial [Rhodoferax sp.]
MSSPTLVSSHQVNKSTVRIAAVQYLLRSINDWDGFENQIRFVMKAAGDYKPQFVMFPEIFTTQLLSFMDTHDLRKAVRELDDYTGRYVALFTELSKRWGVHVIGGSHPTITNGKLMNTAYLFTPEGKVFTQDKIHLTRWEREKWHGDPGHHLRVFETPYGRISIL